MIPVYLNLFSGNDCQGGWTREGLASKIIAKKSNTNCPKIADENVRNAFTWKLIKDKTLLGHREPWAKDAAQAVWPVA